MFAYRRDERRGPGAQSQRGGTGVWLELAPQPVAQRARRETRDEAVRGYASSPTRRSTPPLRLPPRAGGGVPRAPLREAGCGRGHAGRKLVLPASERLDRDPFVVDVRPRPRRFSTQATRACGSRIDGASRFPRRDYRVSESAKRKGAECR